MGEATEVPCLVCGLIHEPTRYFDGLCEECFGEWVLALERKRYAYSADKGVSERAYIDWVERIRKERRVYLEIHGRRAPKGEP